MASSLEKENIVLNDEIISIFQKQNENLEDVMAHYQKIIGRSCDSNQSIFDVYKNVVEGDLTLMHDWLRKQYEGRVLKDNTLSSRFRKQGNSFYSAKKFKTTLYFYTKSLCYAVPNSEEYFLALSNRSACTFEMRKFEECLTDIELYSNNCSYPNNLIPKLYLRKIECLVKLRRKTALLTFLKEVEIYFDKFSVQGQFIERLKKLKEVKIEEECNIDLLSNDMHKLPFLENTGTHKRSTSSKIQLRYNNKKGRHVIAKQNVLQGDILFIEKAFAFGPIFGEQDGKLRNDKCYNCLRNITAGIPCPSCVQCVFCDTTCRDNSWKDCHEWECVGMQANIWSHLGITYPALKALFRGIFRNLSAENCEDTNETKYFGDTEGNYSFFNSLVFHARDTDMGAVVLSSIVIIYLSEYTQFFHWYISQPNCIETDMNKLKINFGKRVVKHMLQLEYNSSIIEHWIDDGSDLPNEKEPVACGIFPSVSMMNHSCKPNVTIYFICDTIIVKAESNIDSGGEVFNSYGVDYRTLDRLDRQSICQKYHNFTCECVICSDNTQELVMLDNYICSECGSSIKQSETMKFISCNKCNKSIDIDELKKLNLETKIIEGQFDERNLLNCLKSKRLLLSEYHLDLQEIYYDLFQFYATTGNCQSMLTYFTKWLKIAEKRKGENARQIGRMLYKVGSILAANIKSDPSSNDKDTLTLTSDRLLRRAKTVCSLYYPGTFIDRVIWI